MVASRASVIVRAKDSASTLEAALLALRAQSVAVEVVVVDSGSTDRTLEIADRHADVVLHLPAERFTFGRALNTGADACSGQVHFALSSHVLPPDERWVERSLAHYADPRVVATTGSLLDPDGAGPLRRAVRQDLAHARAHPRWGMTNTASSWRAEVFAHHRFDEACEASEDKEWALRALADGGVVVVDPLLAVTSHHRRAQGWGPYLHRLRREDRALLRMGLLQDVGLTGAARQWYREGRAAPPGRRGLLSLTRLADTVALVAAQRDVRREARGGAQGELLP